MNRATLLFTDDRRFPPHGPRKTGMKRFTVAQWARFRGKPVVVALPPEKPLLGWCDTPMVWRLDEKWLAANGWDTSYFGGAWPYVCWHQIRVD